MSARLLKPRLAPRFSMPAAAVALALAFMAPVASAQTFRLDDSTSPRARVTPRAVVDEFGRPLNKSLEPDHAVLRFGEVKYRLDTRPHQGHNARIYFVRSPEIGPPTGTRLNWATSDGALKGSLLSGERALVWSGQVTEAWMNVALQLELDFELRRWLPNAKASSADQPTYFELER
jgi:hypothetical protein